MELANPLSESARIFHGDEKFRFYRGYEDDTGEENADRNDPNISLMTSLGAIVLTTAMCHHMDGRNSETSLRQQCAIFDMERRYFRRCSGTNTVRITYGDATSPGRLRA